jgi:hypothetical protein
MSFIIIQISHSLKKSTIAYNIAYENEIDLNK